MQVRLFLLINDIAHPPFAASDGVSYADRCQQALECAYQTLEPIVREAGAVSSDVLPIVICGEDFFGGANIATSSELKSKTGKCLDREMAFRFFQEKLTELSRCYPNVLIIPGSAYLSVDAARNDSVVYKQEGETIRKASIYAQNVMPVFYAGEWLRLIKKGDFLSIPAARAAVKTEQSFDGLIQAGSHKRINAVVPKYAEDSLADMSKGLVFLGATPLPGENALLKDFKPDLMHFYEPVINVAGLRVGLEICGDHYSRRLEKFLAQHPSRIDMHIISSCGIGNIYNAGLVRVQVDAESETLTGVTSEYLSAGLPLMSGIKGVLVANVCQIPSNQLENESAHLSPRRK